MIRCCPRHQQEWDDRDGYEGCSRPTCSTSRSGALFDWPTFCPDCGLVPWTPEAERSRLWYDGANSDELMCPSCWAAYAQSMGLHPDPHHVEEMPCES